MKNKVQEQLDAKKIVKMVDFYFSHRPTCLKKVSDSDSSSSDTPKKGKFYGRIDSSDDGKRKQKYKIRNPYYEDKESYNLETCIQERRKPNFGYPLPNLSDEGEPIGEESVGFDFMFLLPSIVARKREK